MRIVVFGAGAVGGVIAGRLFEHGNDVIAIARGAHFEAMRDHGMRLVDPDHKVTLPVPVVDDPAHVDWRPDDVVVITTKTQDSTGALDALVAAAGTQVPIVCAQNGVANERIALRRFEHVYAICVMLPAEHLEPGVVAASSAPVSGLLDIGRYPAGTDEVATSVAAALSGATFESTPRPDIMRWKYRKLLMNLANAVEALCAPGDDAIELGRRARREGSAVLRAAGIDVASIEEDRERRGDRLTPRLARGGGSTWQSLRRATGSLETDYLNGEIALLARLHGVACPANELLQTTANDAARRGLAPGSVRASDLLAQLPAPLTPE
ncbi:MAG: 2-dehydropantoate 2-reductase [Actinomycetota bacterium]|jgi:2-dehydropantoate 2-reductase|nr:2-dehydropantoate 2-reductase [Actinomycetota bacterium]